MLIEEGYPLIEQQIKGLLNRGLKVKGRLDGSIPRVGELNANIIARALGLPDTQGEAVPDIVVPRPPALCTGCPHTDTYKALNEAIEPYGKGRVFADIGCYTLGALPPHNAILLALTWVHPSLWQRCYRCRIKSSSSSHWRLYILSFRNYILIRLCNGKHTSYRFHPRQFDNSHDRWTKIACFR